MPAITSRYAKIDIDLLISLTKRKRISIFPQKCWPISLNLWHFSLWSCFITTTTTLLMSLFLPTRNQKSQEPFTKKQGWYSSRRLSTVPILITQIFWGCKKPRSRCNCCGHSASSAPHSSPSPPPPSNPPFLMPPRLRVDSASLWQLLITGWPGPAALCMTASRPAQVTQSEGETERVGEKGGWAGQRKRRRKEKGRGDRKGQRG